MFEVYKNRYLSLKNGIYQLGGEDRVKKYHQLSRTIAYLSDDDINKFLQTKGQKASGITKVITIGNQKVFLKGIPVAKLFVENMFDTSNLYKLPAHYNYGMGSAGCNPWRELLMHIKSSSWVLEGKNSSFPLLYHYRIVKNSNKNFATWMDERTMKRWNNNKNITKYLTDRANSEYKIVLFMEYIPHVLGKYLEEKPGFIKKYYDQATKIVKFLNGNGVLHNDAHLFNYLVDNSGKVYLTDFGLSLDKEFKLTKDEMKFMLMNKKIDRYYVIDSIFANYVNRTYWDKKMRKKLKLDKMEGSVNISKHLIKNIDKFAKEVKMSKFQFDFIKKHKRFIIKYIVWEKQFQRAKNKKRIFIP